MSIALASWKASFRVYEAYKGIWAPLEHWARSTTGSVHVWSFKISSFPIALWTFTINLTLRKMTTASSNWMDLGENKKPLGINSVKQFFQKSWTNWSRLLLDHVSSLVSCFFFFMYSCFFLSLILASCFFSLISIACCLISLACIESFVLKFDQLIFADIRKKQTVSFSQS